MNPLTRLGILIASLPVFDIKRNYSFIRRTEDAVAKAFIERSREETAHEYLLIDEYLLYDDSKPKVPLRLFVPRTSLKNGLILFFHGGGFVTGNVDTYTMACSKLATETSRVVCSVDYRLAPENPFPAGLEDCYGVAEELCEFIALKEAAFLRPFVLMGDSAGGNLATVVARKLAENKRGTPDLQVLLYPCVGTNYSDSSPFASVEEKGQSYGLTARKMQDYFSLYLPSESLKHSPDVSPLLARDLHLLPSSFVVTAEHDPLRDEGAYYASLLQEAGVSVEYFTALDVPHGFFSRPQFFPETNQIILNRLTELLDGFTRRGSFSDLLKALPILRDKQKKGNERAQQTTP